MKKVKVIRVYRVKETGTIVHPGHILEYPEARAEELAAGGWVEITGDGEQVETEPAALTGVADGDAPPVDGVEGAQVDEEDSAGPAAPEEEGQPEGLATPVVPEKMEMPVGQPEKVETEPAKAKRGRKPKEQQ